MNYKNSIALLATMLGAVSLGHAQVFSEDFGTITPGTDLTTSNTSFSFVRALGDSSTVESMTSTIGTGSSMFLVSTHSNSADEYVGVGVDGLTASSVFTLSLSLKSNNWIVNHGLIIGLGSATDADGFYSAGGNILGSSSSEINDESLFAVRLFGNSNAGSNPSSAKLQTVGESSWVDSAANVIANNTAVDFHFVVNGGGSDLTVDSQMIASGEIGVWLNEGYLGAFDASNNVAATSLRIFAHGRGGSHTSDLDVEIDNIGLWNSAVVPGTAIPEPSSYAMMFGGLSLVFLLLRRRVR